MARYRYKARTLDGQPVEAVADALDDRALEERLTEQGMVLISAAQMERRSKFKDVLFGTGTAAVLNPMELVLFTMEVSTSYKAGLPLLQTLEDMALSGEKRNIREVCKGISERVRGGASLGDSLAAFPKAFPELYVDLIRAAEQTGKLDRVLDDLVRFLEWQKETRGQIIGASVYPVALLGAVIGLGLILTLFVFPRFLDTFKNMGGKLPLPTKMLLGIENFVHAHHIALIVVVVGVPTAYLSLRNVPAVRMTIDMAKLRNPIVGPLLTKLYMSLFSHNLGMMIGSGLDFSNALRLVERIVKNVVFQNLIADARNAVENGRPLSDAMTRGNLVPSLVKRMLKLGETTGSMEDSLENVSRYYDKEVPRAIKKMFQIMEPLVLVTMAGVVLFMASAVLLPLYGMINQIGGQH